MKKISLAVFLITILLLQCITESTDEIDLEYKPEKALLFAPNVISTNLYERDIAISPDGKEIIYTLGDYRQSKRCLVRIVKTGKKWGSKEILSFSGLYDDIEPFFSTDGNKLFFASNRPISADSARKDFNIWVAEKTTIGWEEPEPIQSGINTENDEFFPSVSRNDNLYFTSVRENGTGSEDIFMSRYVNGIYSDPEPLDTTINTLTYEFNACIDPDETLILFSSYGRKDDMGGGDLYYSIKDKDGRWMAAVNLGSLINSEGLDFCPFIDTQRGNFYFTSDRAPSMDKRIESVKELERFANNVLNGTGNIYRIQIDQIFPK